LGLFNAEAIKLGKSYDAGGEIARGGELNLTLFEQLNQLAFYSATSAKSLGREDMEGDFFPLIHQANLSPADTLNTLVEHFAFQISAVIRSYSQSPAPLVLITGGGAYNTYFVERLDHWLHSSWVKYEASPELIEFKEALIFAFLGLLKLLGKPNCLASVTGASRDNSGGVIYG
jgi:anhydro-N-acetylmuramic acid kinase